MRTFSIKQNPKIQSIWRILTHPLIILFFANLLVYGFSIPLLGFYWDDLDFYWLHLHAGNEGLVQYFATDGPFLGLLYQFNFNLLGNEPWRWQAFAFFWRYVCASGIYFLIRQLIKNHKEPAIMGSMVFLFFPGFSQQYIAMCYGHYFIALSSLVFSLGLSIYVMNQPKHWRFLNLLAILLAMVNLFTTEYFFMLELLRPILIWVVIAGKSNRLLATFKWWWPFLMTFVAVVLWRAFFFGNQTATYDFAMVELIKSQPWLGIKKLFLQITNDLWWAIIATWKKIVLFPSMTTFGRSVTFLYIGITIILAGLFTTAVWNKESHLPRRQALFMIFLGLVASLLAGIPFWSTGLPLGEYFPNDRFVLPFIIGSGFCFIGLLNLLPARPYFRKSLFILLLALAGGLQMRTGITYKRDWEALQRFMWQMTWRIPAIEENTILFSNELPLSYYSDLSLTAPLNVAYRKTNSITAVPYLYIYPTTRYRAQESLMMPTNQPVTQYLYIGQFNGNTSRSITIYFSPPACLRVIDPEIELNNWMVPLYVRQTAALSTESSRLINSSSEPNFLTPIFTDEPTNNWCYAFEKADLARQTQNWTEVTAIADEVITGKEKPVDPMERLVYIEGYAHTGNWEKSIALTETTLAVTGAMRPPLCSLWQRIESQTQASEIKNESIAHVQRVLNCEKE